MKLAKSALVSLPSKYYYHLTPPPVLQASSLRSSSALSCMCGHAYPSVLTHAVKCSIYDNYTLLTPYHNCIFLTTWFSLPDSSNFKLTLTAQTTRNYTVISVRTNGYYLPYLPFLFCYILTLLLTSYIENDWMSCLCSCCMLLLVQANQRPDGCLESLHDKCAHRNSISTLPHSYLTSYLNLFVEVDQ